MCELFFKDYLATVLWLIFTGLFFLMSFRECKKWKQPLRSLQSTPFPNGKIVLQGVNFADFAKELEKSNQESHKIAATAYLLAGVTALLSAVLSVIEI